MTAPLSIALATYSTRPRGGVVHTVELAEALHDLGASVCIYALEKEGSGFYREPRCPYVLLPTAPASGDIDAVIRQRIEEVENGLRRASRRHDIWHAQDCITANGLATLRAEGRIEAFIRTVHHLDDFESAYLRACQDRSVRSADACFSVSDAWREILRASHGVDAPVVPNGVNTRRFSPDPDESDEALRRRLGLAPRSTMGPPSDAPVFVTVGGVEPRKNSMRLLEAFIEVRRRIAGSRLVIAGGETVFDYAAYREDFSSAARAAGLFAPDERSGGACPPIPPTPQQAREARPLAAPALVLAGVLPDTLLPALYRLADAFVFPSIREGFGLALLEAMASGAPVVSSARPPFTELLTDGETALLADPTRVESIAAAMTAILDRGLSARLRAASLEIARRMSWQRSAQVAMNLYRAFLRRS